MEESAKRDLIPCGCGCRQLIPKFDKRERLRKYVKGHQSRGQLHYNYKGGYLTKFGYVNLPKRDHHFANSNGNVLEHRLVWEEYHKAVLLPWAYVHHKNSVKNDNRIENLDAMMAGQHTSLHNYINKRKDMSGRKCLRCGRTKTGKLRGIYDCWSRHPITKEEWYCRNCGNIIRRQLKKGD